MLRKVISLMTIAAGSILVVAFFCFVVLLWAAMAKMAWEYLFM